MCFDKVRFRIRLENSLYEPVIIRILCIEFSTVDHQDNLLSSP